MPPLLLYMEDDNNNRMLIHRVLQAENFDVISADNAHDGIKMALQFLPDIILMDISMPTMDGYTATNALRQFPELDGIPIVAVTAHALAGDREMALESGCDGYIPKPIDVDTFPTEIRTYLTDKLGYAYRDDLGTGLSKALGIDGENLQASTPQDLFPLLATHAKSSWVKFLVNQLSYGSQAIQGRAVIALALWHINDNSAPHNDTVGQRYFWSHVHDSLSDSTRFKAETYWSRVTKVASALTEGDTKAMHTALRLCMRSDKGECREWALRILDIERASKRLKLARKAISDTVAGVRTVAIDILVANVDEIDLPIFERALSDRDRYVREQSARGLATLPDDVGLPSLIHALRTGQDSIAEVIPNALALIGTEQAITELIDSLSYRRDIGVLRHIVTSLGQVNDDRCYQALQTLTQHDNPTVRELVAQCLKDHPAR